MRDWLVKYFRMVFPAREQSEPAFNWDGMPVKGGQRPRHDWEPTPRAGTVHTQLDQPASTDLGNRLSRKRGATSTASSEARTAEARTPDVNYGKKEITAENMNDGVVYADRSDRVPFWKTSAPERKTSQFANEKDPQNYDPYPNRDPDDD